MRIDLKPGRHGGVAGELLLCPYAAVFLEAGTTSPRTVTDYFVPDTAMWSELQTLARPPAGTQITPSIAEVVGYGCEELGGSSVARLRSVEPMALAAPRLAETALLRRLTN